MKSVVFSLYLLTVALGDCIIIAIAALNVFKDLAIQNLVYAGFYFECLLNHPHGKFFENTSLTLIQAMCV
jgi:hypothetical protein